MGLPSWDNTGLYATGRYQFQTGCMVQAGNDCGCFLVDTVIEGEDRGTCTKGEWLTGGTYDLGYGNFDPDRVFEVKIISAEFGDGRAARTAIPKDQLRQNTNVFIRGRPNTCDEADEGGDESPRRAVTDECGEKQGQQFLQEHWSQPSPSASSPTELCEQGFT